MEGAEDRARAAMHRLNPDCWVWSPRPPLLRPPPHHTESHQQEEEEEEEAGEHPALCCYTTGCDDIMRQAADAPWSRSEAANPSGPPGCSGGDPSQHFRGADCWEDPGAETQRCACVYRHGEPEGPGPCWMGSPYIYYGVRRSLVVGVEVVEEVAVEDTLEVITEDVYTDDLLDTELLLQTEQLYPT